MEAQLACRNVLGLTVTGVIQRNNLIGSGLCFRHSFFYKICWLLSSTLGFLKFVFLVWFILSVADTWKLKLAVMWTTLNNFLIFLFCLLLFVENIRKIVRLMFYRMSNKNKVWRQQIHIVVLSWWNPKRLEHILAAILLCTLWVQPAKSPSRCQARALDREFLIGKWLSQLIMILSVSESYYHSS